MTQSCQRLDLSKLKFRPELNFTLVKENTEEKIYTLHDPFNDRYFHFRDYEYIICSLIDGNSTPEEICKNFEEKCEVILPVETLKVFLNKLVALGLIEGTEIPAKKDKYSGPLIQKFKLFNPDKLFDFLIKYVGFCFTPLSIKIGWLSIAIGLFILLKRWDELFNYGLPYLGSSEFSTYGVIGFCLIFIVSTHEFAHGLSLKYYGGKVPELGFMILIFMPAFYCDVSDAWKLPKKEKLFVTFAGGFYEIIVGCIALIIWNFAEPHLWLSNISYLIVIASIVTIGFNFNPLIRLDGYYLLSDFLEIPNLRTESMEYIMRHLLKGIKKFPNKTYTTREKIIFLSYGILSTLFIIFMLSSIFGLASGWLIDNLRLSGVLISLFILTYLLYKIFKGIIKMFTPENQAN